MIKMSKSKEIVGTFNQEMNNIHFYEIESHYKKYTILRSQDGKSRLLYNRNHNNIHVYADITNVIDYTKIDINDLAWDFSNVFFWADSPFVTEYGDPQYGVFLEMYKMLKMFRENMCVLRLEYETKMMTSTGFTKAMTWLAYNLNININESRMRKQLKRMKVIW